MSDVPTLAPALPPALCTPEALQASILSKLNSHVGRRRSMATKRDWLLATAIVVRDFAVGRWLDSLKSAQRSGAKRVYYLSLEFLIGRLLFDNLNNLNSCRRCVRRSPAWTWISTICARSSRTQRSAMAASAGLRPASWKAGHVDIPAYGYGIRYELGLFRQDIKDGGSMRAGGLARPRQSLGIRTPGNAPTRSASAAPSSPPRTAIISGSPEQKIIAVAYDMPVVGWRAARVNTLRLWSALPFDKLRLDLFNEGDHTARSDPAIAGRSHLQGSLPANSTPAARNCVCGRSISSFPPRCRT